MYNKMIVEVSQHGITVQTLLKILLLTSSCWSLLNKGVRLLCVYEPNQHFDVLWVGLLVPLFLFSLPDQPRSVYRVAPPPLLGSVSLAAFSWDGQWLRPSAL